MAEESKEPEPLAPIPPARMRPQMFADFWTLLSATEQFRVVVAELKPLSTFEAWNPYSRERQEFDKAEGTAMYNRLLQDLLRRFDTLVLGAEAKAIEQMPMPLQSVQAPKIISGKGHMPPGLLGGLGGKSR